MLKNQTPIFLQKELKKILEQEFDGYLPFETKKEFIAYHLSGGT